MDIMDPLCIRKPFPLSSHKEISTGGCGSLDQWGLDYENLKLLTLMPTAFTSLSSDEDACHCCQGPIKGQCSSKPTCVCGNSEMKQTKQKSPIWERRGANPIPPLKLDPLIRCEGWLENYFLMEPGMELVRHKEWVTKAGYFEVHSVEDVGDGVVINPPTYPAWYNVHSSSKVVPAQLPYCTEILINRALRCGYDFKNLTSSMGLIIADYSTVLVHPKRRASQEILILAGKEWQGTAAIFAAVQLRSSQINVSVYIHESGVQSIEEAAFAAAGGKIYRNLEDLKGRKFRVIVVALEGQHSGPSSILPLFGDLLQHSVAVFVDPPVIKSSYSNALQYACNGAYNISQKTVIFTPALPKTYVVDDFVEIFVVDVGIIPEIYTSCGMEPFNFQQRISASSKVQLVTPKKFTVRGNKIQFYSNGEPVA